MEYGNGLNAPGYKDSKTPSGSLELLKPSEHTTYRSGGGILQYIQDRRGDVSFPTKEVLRHAHAPTRYDHQKLQRIARYTKRVPRCIQHFVWKEKLDDYINDYVDSDWSGEEDTRKSTSGGAITLCDTELKHWRASQPTVSLSSGEAETKAVVKGVVEGLYVVNVLKQQDCDLHIKLHTDSSASLGHCNRLGNGKRMRHLEGAELWIQQVIRTKRVQIVKINGKANPADLFTKYLNCGDITRNMSLLGFELINEWGEECGVKSTTMEFDTSFEVSAVEMELDTAFITLLDRHTQYLAGVA